MKNIGSTSLQTLLMGLFLAAPTVGFAQFNPFAPTSAMDELNSAPVGGPSFALDRARGAVGQANARPGAADDPFGATDPFGGGGGDPFGGGGGDPFAGGGFNFGDFGGTAVTENTVSAIAGERIICRRTGQVLQEPREIQVLASASSSYFDDGSTGGDVVAGDGVYTNITTSDAAFLSPEAHAVKTKLLRTLEYSLENIDPMRFNLERVATTEPISSLPKVLDLEAAQDAVLAEWLVTFLRDYRENPSDPNSPLIQTYMPPPPRAPNIPLPTNFTPIPPPQSPNGGQFGGAGGTLFDGGVTGDPVGGASSRYF